MKEKFWSLIKYKLFNLEEKVKILTSVQINTWLTKLNLF